MLLELKKAEDYFQYHVRRLIRAAKKEDIHLDCYGRGILANELHLNNLRNGPIHFREEHECLILAKRGDVLSQHLLHLNLDEELDQPRILEIIRHKMETSPLVEGVDELPKCYPPEHNVPLDEKLLTLPMMDWLDHFKSRFLIDMPKKMLYDGLLKKGLSYQCYLGEEINFNISKMSFFDHEIHQRGEDHIVHLRRSGLSLREMYLDPIRVVCSKIWDSTYGSDTALDHPISILFSDVMIYRCYDAIEKHRNENPHHEWSWVRPLNSEDGLPSPRLRVEDSGTHPLLSRWIMENFNTRILPQGDMKESLESFMKGDIPSEQLLFLQDANVEADHHTLSFVTTASSLIIQKGSSSPTLVSNPLSFTLNLEKVSESLSSKKLSLHLAPNLPEAWLPSYILMDNVEVQRVVIT